MHEHRDPARAPDGLDRRHVLRAAGLVALLTGLPLAACSRAPAGTEPVSARQQKLLVRVVDLVIPKTDTPGAAETGVADFVVLGLAHGLEGANAPVDPRPEPDDLAAFRRQNGSVRHLAWLEASLDAAAGGDWLKASPNRQVELLSALDAQAYPPGPPPKVASPWRTLKSLILNGYYTSEVGASQELQFELTPGRFDPDLPLAVGARAWSSDWTSVEFG